MRTVLILFALLISLSTFAQQESVKQKIAAAAEKLETKIIEFGHPNLHGEVSFLKGREEGYGVKDTVRIDVLERVNHNTACIHDIKTGRSPLTFPRMLEMVVNSQRMYKGQITHFIVTEVKPTQ